FSVTVNLPRVYAYSAVAWGDFDNAGRLDFAVCGSTNGAVSGAVTRIYRNAGNNTFTNIYVNPASGPIGVWKGTVAWADYDNDGDLDLIVSGQTASGALVTKIYRNEAGLFTDSGESLPGLQTDLRRC